MSLRYTGAWMQDGAFNPLAAPTPIYGPSTLWSWGRNNSGQLGLGNTTYYSSPKQVGALTDWLKTSSGGYNFNLAIKNDGTLWSWGANNVGQLGLGNTTNRSSPNQVGALTDWLNIAGGYKFTIAIKNDGTLWAWGINSSGQLGLGNTTSYSSPKQVGALTNWVSVSAQNVSSFAIKSDGTLWAWGSGEGGRLGLNNTSYYSSPKQVGALNNWSNVYAYGQYCLAIKTDGTMWSWGYNNLGQLGLGTSGFGTYKSSPTQIGALTTWIKAAAGAYASYSAAAIRSDGTLWAWGSNGSGRLGTGNTTNYSSPIQIGSGTTWKAVGVGTNHMAAITTGGALYATGGNGFGQLGLGDQVNRSSLTQVGALTSWYSVSNLGYYSTTAIQY